MIRGLGRDCAVACEVMETNGPESNRGQSQIFDVLE